MCLSCSRFCVVSRVSLSKFPDLAARSSLHPALPMQIHPNKKVAEDLHSKDPEQFPE